MAFPYTLPIVFLDSATALDVAGTVINDAAIEIGLAASDDPFNDTNANMVQMRTLLKSLGRDLWRRHTWPALTKIYTFTTTAADGSYALPEDYGYFISETAWNRSTSLPATPLTPREWQAIKGQSTQVTFSNYFRIRQHQLEILPDTQMPAGNVIAFEYVSRYWVRSASAAVSASPDKSAPTQFDDVLWYDPLLLTRGLKWMFLDAKGLPTAASAKEQFDETLYLCMGDDETGGVIDTCASADTYRLIDSRNLPDTGHAT